MGATKTEEPLLLGINFFPMLDSEGQRLTSLSSIFNKTFQLFTPDILTSIPTVKHGHCNYRDK
jgi:hypothetical protein